MSVCGNVRVSAGTLRSQKRVSVTGAGVTGGCELPAWVLGAELGSSARATRALIAEPSHELMLDSLDVNLAQSRIRCKEENLS